MPRKIGRNKNRNTLDENTILSLGAYDMVYDLNGTGDFRIQDNENDVLFVANSGNIGIGTTNPLYKLDIYQEGLMDVEIGVLNYYGSGLDDMSSVGTFTGSEETVYAVRIDSEGTPDTFAWTDDAWETNTTGVPITGGTQPLNNGVIVSFSNTTGHTAYDDYWEFTVNIQKNPAANLFGIRDWKGDYAFHVDSNGNIGIGTTSSEERLTLAGGNFYHYAEGNPILAGSYSAVSGIYVVGDYVYATGAEGFEIIDVTDPSKPSLAGSYPGVYGEVIVSGNYAYVLGGSSLNILDISNIASPTLLGTYNEGGRDFYLSGKYAYISRYSDYMSIVDISNPASPLLAGTYNYPAYHHGEAIGGNGKYIYLNLYRYNSWIQVIDVSNPVNPSDVGLYILPQSRKIVDIDISGNYAYVATNYGSTCTYILDISNPQSPQNISYINAYGRYGQGIYVSGNYAYRAAILGENGGGILSVVNISNPLEPVQVGYYLAYQDFGPSVRGVFVSGKYAYLEGDDSLFILDINGIETPTLNAGNIKVGDLFVTDNINIGKDLSIRNSLNIGTGGLYSQGAASIMLGALLCQYISLVQEIFLIYLIARGRF